MIGRILRILLIIGIIALIIQRLFNRRQKRAIREVVQISAWVFLAATALALLWFIYQNF